MVCWKEYQALTIGEEGWVGIRRREDTRVNLAHMFWYLKDGTGNTPTRGDIVYEDKKENRQSVKKGFRMLSA